MKIKNEERIPCAKKNARELTKTHYSLGTNRQNYLTQYKHDYPPYPFDSLSPLGDSVALRKSSFKKYLHPNYFIILNKLLTFPYFY